MDRDELVEMLIEPLKEIGGCSRWMAERLARAALAVAEPAVREAVREACAAKLEADAEKYRSAAVNAYFAETAQTNDAVAEAIDSEAAAIRAGGPEHG